MRMPLLRAADEALLHRRGPFGVDRAGSAQSTPARSSSARSSRPSTSLPMTPARRHVGLEAAEHVGHVGRSAQPRLAAFLAQQDDGGFLADAFGVAPGVAVEDQVAQHEHPRPAQFLKQIDQMIRQGPIPLRYHCGRRPLPPEGERPVRYPWQATGAAGSRFDRVPSVSFAIIRRVGRFSAETSPISAGEMILFRPVSVNPGLDQ